MNQQPCSCGPHPRTRKGARAADAARRADNPLHGAGHSACRPHSPRLRPPLQLPQRPQQAGVGIRLRPLLHHQTQLLCACVSTSLQQPARPTLMSAAPSSPSAAMVSSGVCHAAPCGSGWGAGVFDGCCLTRFDNSAKTQHAVSSRGQHRIPLWLHCRLR